MPWLSFEPWDKIRGEAANLSEKERLARLEALIQAYIVTVPEYLFHWGSRYKINILLTKDLSTPNFTKIYKLGKHFPKGMYFSSDPYDSNDYGKTFLVLRLPKNSRKFVDLTSLLSHLPKLGYPNLVSNRLYKDLNNIGIKGAIWGNKTWSFIFSSIEQAQFISPESYLKVLKNQKTNSLPYKKESLEKALKKISVKSCPKAF